MTLSHLTNRMYAQQQGPHASPPPYPTTHTRTAATTIMGGEQDEGTWSVVPTKSSQPHGKLTRAGFPRPSSGANGVVRIDVDDARGNGRVAHVSVGSDEGVDGPMRPALERLRASLGSRAPPCSRVSVRCSW